jgi:hypothetical protein
MSAGTLSSFFPQIERIFFKEIENGKVVELLAPKFNVETF